MELRAQDQHRLVGGQLMLWCLTLALSLAQAQDSATSDRLLEQIQNAQAGISETDRKQRETLGALFLINKRIKAAAKEQADLTRKLLVQEGQVRVQAQEVADLEKNSEEQRLQLNNRLRQLYQTRGEDKFQWLFSAGSPVEIERNHRFLSRMIDSDHRRLKVYAADLRHARAQREKLKQMVGKLSRMQKDVQVQEKGLSAQLGEKSRILNELKESKDLNVGRLRGLRAASHDVGMLSFAFFERKGDLHPPVDVKPTRDFGTYVDSQFRFRLTHKGLFYATEEPREVVAVADARVVVARKVPGYGKMVMLDHGDNYYSVYAFATSLQVAEGKQVKEGELLALSGADSPLFGPGLYFEIRHFTEAIDPRPWFKGPPLKTANSF